MCQTLSFVQVEFFAAFAFGHVHHPHHHPLDIAGLLVIHNHRHLGLGARLQEPFARLENGEMRWNDFRKQTKVRIFMRFPKIFPMAFLVWVFAATPFHSPASPARLTEDFDANWLFSKSDFASAMMPAFDDGNWRKLEVPHDWSIEGPFSPDYGSGNGFVPGGIGWYRKHFRLDAAQKNKRVMIEFDGVYDHSEVWINGQFAGGRF